MQQCHVQAVAKATSSVTRTLQMGRWGGLVAMGMRMLRANP